jgi:hypothetical protein
MLARVEREVAYLAGFFDADGSMSLYLNHGNVMLKASVCGVHEGSIRRFKNRFGGSVVLQKPTPGHLGKKTVWRWQAYGSKAQVALLDMLPHLVVKAPQANLAAQLHIGTRVSRWTDGERAERVLMIRLMHELKEEVA